MRSLRRDEEYVWRTFKDDPVLKMVMAAREGGGSMSDVVVGPVALAFGIPEETTADTEMAKKIKKIHTEVALFATRNVVTWVEQSLREAGNN